ncbi:helix-turn-helix transcriptional regulator [Actinotalea sp. M2MS4P-6]|uniref:helix-turn-helix transcriptional regulator n=1 Tax=Actinotalea sp. M2MS4P-6 TaxID=2983762 RepID=UPI0029621756|nr:helix-turn-helix transcriptional regulator [Actinotalea sp. M2MS4P-6]
MPVEQVRTTQAVRGPVRPVRPRAPFPPSQRTAPPREGAAVCLVLPEIGDGDAAVLVRNLRRRESSHAVLLARSAGRRELVTLLNGGIRGAITTEPDGDGGLASAAHRTGPELTARELGVLELVAEGRSNKQIGETLELSALTVKSHLARISRKIGTGDRAEMVAFAIRNQLLG